MAALFLVCCMAAYWVGLELDLPHGVLVASLAATLASSSPMFQLLGALVMLELPGTLLILLSMGFYLRYLRSQRLHDLILTCLATTAVFFCKYNYGLMWLVPLFINEVWRTPPRRAWLAETLRRNLHPRVLVRPWPLFLAGYGAFLLWIVVTGGGVWRIGEHVISVRSLGNPVYALAWILIARMLLKPGRLVDWSRFVRTRAEPRIRTFLALVGGPILLWLMVPAHMKDFFGFLENRESGLGLLSPENLLFYPRALAVDYSISPIIGSITVILGLASLAWLARARASDRVLLLTLGFGLCAALLHPYKASRFIFAVAPLLWLAAGYTLARLMMGLERRIGGRPTAAVALVLACAAPVWMLNRGWDEARFRDAFASSTVPASVRPVLDAAVGAPNVSRMALLGTWNGLSPGLVRWHSLLRHPDRRERHMPLVQADLSRSATPDELLRAVRDRNVEEVLLVRLARTGEAWAPAFDDEAAYADGVLEALAAAPEFERIEERAFDPSGYRLIRFSRVPEGSLEGAPEPHLRRPGRDGAAEPAPPPNGTK